MLLRKKMKPNSLITTTIGIIYCCSFCLGAAVVSQTVSNKNLMHGTDVIKNKTSDTHAATHNALQNCGHNRTLSFYKTDLNLEKFAGTWYLSAISNPRPCNENTENNNIFDMQSYRSNILNNSPTGCGKLVFDFNDTTTTTTTNEIKLTFTDRVRLELFNGTTTAANNNYPPLLKKYETLDENDRVVWKKLMILHPSNASAAAANPNDGHWVSTDNDGPTGTSDVSDVYVIDTDYTSYAVWFTRKVWTFSSDQPPQMEEFWHILSRQPKTFYQDKKEKLTATALAAGVPQRGYNNSLLDLPLYEC